jgi:hypothetical protein
MKNEIEIIEVNGFELLFEEENQTTSDQEIEINLNNETYIVCVDIDVEYNGVEPIEGKFEFEVECINVSYSTAYNTENEEVILTKEEINDIETYLEFNLKN